MLIISYDLNKSGQNYQALYDAIKEQGNWWHYLDSTWLLKTNLSVHQVGARLRRHIDNNDNLLVMEVDPQIWSGLLPKEAAEWITSP